MTRQLLLCSAIGLLALSAAPAAGAVDLPVRKAGLWEMKVVHTGSPIPEMTMQHCTDETTDKEMSTAFSPMGKEMCSKQDIQKTASGYVSDSVCGVAGMTVTSHAEISGDFNSAYTVKSTSHSEGGPTGKPRDATTTIVVPSCNGEVIKNYFGSCLGIMPFSFSMSLIFIFMPPGIRMSPDFWSALQAPNHFASMVEVLSRAPLGPP